MALCTKFNILVHHSPPRHAPSNSYDERGVGIAKKAMEKMLDEIKRLAIVSNVPNSTDVVQERVHTFLFNYHNTPSTVTGKAPNEMLLGFRPRSLISQLNPAISSSSGLPSTFVTFKPGDHVFIRYEKMPTIQGIVMERLGDSRYYVGIAGVVKQVHSNNLFKVPFGSTK